MLFRVLLAAVMVMALAMAGVGHAAPAGASEGVRMASQHGEAAHSADHAHDHGAPAAEKAPKGCDDASHCIGCVAHCPNGALMAAPALPTQLRSLWHVDMREERLRPGIVPPTERPPETI